MGRQGGGPARRPATIKPNLQKKMRAVVPPVVKPPRPSSVPKKK